MASDYSGVIQLIEIFEDLLGLERKAAENYSRLSLSVENRDFKSRLAKIAADEERHADLVEEALIILQKI